METFVTLVAVSGFVGFVMWFLPWVIVKRPAQKEWYQMGYEDRGRCLASQKAYGIPPFRFDPHVRWLKKPYDKGWEARDAELKAEDR